MIFYTHWEWTLLCSFWISATVSYTSEHAPHEGVCRLLIWIAFALPNFESLVLDWKIRVARIVVLGQMWTIIQAWPSSIMIRSWLNHFRDHNSGTAGLTSTARGLSGGASKEQLAGKGECGQQCDQHHLTMNRTEITDQLISAMFFFAGRPFTQHCKVSLHFKPQWMTAWVARELTLPLQPHVLSIQLVPDKINSKQRMIFNFCLHAWLVCSNEQATLLRQCWIADTSANCHFIIGGQKPTPQQRHLTFECPEMILESNLKCGILSSPISFLDARM